MIRILRDIWKIPELRSRIFWTILMLVVFRMGFFVFLPGIDIPTFLASVSRQRQSGALDWLTYTSALTGGNLNTPVLFSLGIMPYISASIIFSLMIKVFPRLEALSKEGEQGRRTINRYTRYSTVVICLVQACFLVNNWRRPVDGVSISTAADFFAWESILQILTLSVGSLFLMWLGEKITEYGIGNGTSLIIMVGILADLPAAFGMIAGRISTASADQQAFEVTKALISVLLYCAVVAGVVFITKGQRRIPVQQQRTVKGHRVYGGARQYMPIKVNAAGVLPIIFAQSLIVIPSTFLTAFAFGHSDNEFFRFIYNVASAFHRGGFFYMVAFVGMIFFFTYFWTTLMFNPVEIAGNMKEYGSFIPGIRPGKFTAEYLEKILKRITLAGAAFLCAIALVPQIVAGAVDVDYFIAHFMGGTTILIIVGVALDLVDKIEAQLLVREYEGFMRTGEGPRRSGSE